MDLNILKTMVLIHFYLMKDKEKMLFKLYFLH
jgi:hypothetical protein